MKLLSLNAETLGFEIRTTPNPMLSHGTKQAQVRVIDRSRTECIGWGGYQAPE
ncbi:hypothetical protein DENIT_110132 [Pseudomonas veronii]|nr:hypothetical protein DENIT_110132 [Pseudomonas veronii]